MNQPRAMPDPGGLEESVLHADTTLDLHSGIPGGFATAVAHELNQPLAAVLGNAQAARRFINAGDVSRDELLAILDDIIHDTKRAAGMIRNLQTPRSGPQQEQGS